MIRINVSARDRRTLLVGAAVIAATLAVSRGVPAARTWEQERIGAAREAATQRAFADLSQKELGVIRDTLAQRQRRLDSLLAPMITSATTDVAAASLATLVQRLADDSGLGVSSVALSPDSVAAGGFARVSVRLSGEGDVTALMDLLQVIETRRTPLSVNELNISQPDPSAPKTKVEVLHFDVMVQTLARIEPAAKPGRRS